MGGGADIMNLPFVIILSDGRFNKGNVRPYLNEAHEKRYLYIFVILDSVNSTNKDSKKSDGSILSMKSVEKN
jgi:midasin (ATPase involved in ribosome maturation)